MTVTSPSLAQSGRLSTPVVRFVTKQEDLQMPNELFNGYASFCRVWQS